MSNDATFAKEYCQKIKNYLDKGYAIRLTPQEASQRFESTLYIPHFGVKNPNMPGIRLVFDAAAEVDNISLNKCLLSGPDLNQPLVAIFI